MRAIRDQAAIDCKKSIWINHRQAVARRHCNDRIPVRGRIGLREDDETAIRLSSEGGNRALRVAVDVDCGQLNPTRGRDRFGCVQIGNIAA
jgi:hypothetical protein